MAKRRKALPARPPTEGAGDEHSLLLRSAESLGRVIGALQRQLDDATRRLSLDGNEEATTVSGPAMTRNTATARKATAAASSRKTKAAARGGTKKKSVARKPASAKRKRAATRH